MLYNCNIACHLVFVGKNLATNEYVAIKLVSVFAGAIYVLSFHKCSKFYSLFT